MTKIESVYRDIVESTRDLAVVFDEHGRVHYANPAARRALALAEDEERRFFDALPPAQRDELTAQVRRLARQAAAGGGSQALVEALTDRHEHPAATIVWNLALLANSGSAPLFVACGVDVGESLRAGQEIERRERYMRTVLSSVVDGVVTIDDHGIVRDANRSMETMFGWPPEELRGQNIAVLMPEPHRTAHDGYLARYRETGVTWILNTVRQFDVLRRDGRLMKCELSVSRVDVPGESGPTFCGVFRDVTARVETEARIAASERKFRAVFDQEFQLVIVLDDRGRILEPNESAIEFVGVPGEALVGQPIWELPAFADSVAANRLREWISTVSSGGFSRSEIVMRAANGTLRSFDLSLKSIRREDSREPFVIFEARDITELKRAQQAETSMMRALADLGESAAILAHEIKNPITSINVALRAVAKQLGTEENAVLADLAKRMQDLEAKLRRTLSFAKPLDLRPAPCSPRELLRQAADALEPEFRQRGTQLSIDVAKDCPALLADEAHLEQVLVNLLRNALDALEEGGHVRLSARGEPGGERPFVVLTVEDDGPGIPKHMRETLFRPFTTSKSGGTGIGLALSRRIVNELGGRIEVGDAPGGGAAFLLRIPAAVDYVRKRRSAGTVS